MDVNWLKIKDINKLLQYISPKVMKTTRINKDFIQQKVKASGGNH